MAKDLFGGFGNLSEGLGGLMKGLSNIMPQDDPEVQLLKAQTEADDFLRQESELYLEIGKQAVERYGLEEFNDLGEKLKLVQANLVTANEKLNNLKEDREKKEQEAKEIRESRTCPSCGHENPEGVKFCQECGANIRIKKIICPQCGTENPPNTRFCGECGYKLVE